VHAREEGGQEDAEKAEEEVHDGPARFPLIFFDPLYAKR
jgi:hypothetical protein